MKRWLLARPGVLLTLCVGCQTPGAMSVLPRPGAAPHVVAVPNAPPSPYAVMLSPGDSLPTTADAPPAIQQAKAPPDRPTFEPYTKQPAPAPLPRLEPIAIPPAPNPSPPEMPKKNALVLAVECLLDNRPDEIRRHLKDYDPETQEFLLRLLAMLPLVDGNKNLDPKTNAAIREQLEALSKSLEQNSSFVISSLAFCDSIRGFKIYNPLPTSHEFLAAQPDRPGELVQLYVELKNFASEPAVGAVGAFETRLSSKVEIRDARGQVRWAHHFRPSDLKLVSRTRLSEYYHNYTFALPALPAGVYELHVETSDETHPNRSTARASLPLRVK